MFSCIISVAAGSKLSVAQVCEHSGKHQGFAWARSFGGGSSSRVAPARLGSGSPELRLGPLDGDAEVDVLIDR